jgi:hypothetical protein
MNSRNTIAVVAAFLMMFWIFGLVVSVGKTRADEAALFPSLKTSNYEIDEIVVERKKAKEPDEFRFTRNGEQWNLDQGKQSIKVDAVRVRELMREARDARRDEETTVPNDPAAFGLKPPRLVITMTGHPRKKDKDDDKKPDLSREKQWKLLVGSDSVDKKFVYAASSDRPGRVFAVPRTSLNSLFFRNANEMRSKRPFDFSEASVQSFVLKEGGAEFEAKKTTGGTWLIVKPNLGYADFEGPPPPKDAPLSAPTPDGGLKSLLAAIAAVRVDSEDDFVSPASDTLQRNDLALGKERLRIQVFSGDEKKPTEETLLIGREEKDSYYARLSTDEGAFKLPKKLLAPIFEALKTPDKLRSRDLSPITIKDADAIILTQGKDEARILSGGEPRVVQVELPGAGRSPANTKAVESLLEALQGRRDVIAFRDVADADAGKVDAELGFDFPQATIAVYLGGIEPSKDAFGKDPFGKDPFGKNPFGKDAKKEEPTLKKDAKPAGTWQFGKVDKDQVWVKRTMADGPTARFAISKTAFDKILPREGLLGFVESSLPKVNPFDVVRIEIDRGGKKVTLNKSGDRWLLHDTAGDVPADAKKVEDVVRQLAGLQIRRWVKKIDAKDDLDAYGLKSPGVTATLSVKLDKLNAQTIGSALGQLSGVMNDPAFAALGAAWSNIHLAGEKVVVKFGKEATDGDAGALFVQHSKSDRLSLAPALTSNLLRDTDFRDRSTVLQPEVHIAALAVGTPGFLSASPLVTAQLGRGGSSQVKQLRVTVRTPVEVRSFSFARKDKGWTDQSGLKEFQLDEENVNILADLVARLDFNRIVLLKGGPKADQKLTAKDASLVIEAVMSDLSPVTLTVGANFEGIGFFAQSSTWPGAVFLLNSDRVQPLLRGAGFFAKERVAAN